MHEFADHFSTLANDYAAFRPVYPRSLASWLAGLAPSRSVALDCGTGNGQAARLLAEEFERVIASDASREQLAKATPHPRVAFHCAPAERSGLSDASVDLINVAAAIHWFDRERFYAEARRVLKPGGVLAAYSYDLVHLSSELDACVAWFYDRVRPYWPAGRRHVEARYRDFEFPFDELHFGERAIEAQIDRRAYLGYIGTWSAVARCREVEGRDPIPELAARVAPLWPDASEKRRAIWPLFGRVGRV